MQVAISGYSGFIGKELTGALDDKGFSFTLINRDSFSMSDDEFREKKIEGKDAVINLAGSPILRKWTDKNRRDIYSSRIDTTGKIARAIRSAKVRPRVLANASAIGIYAINETHTETSTRFGDDFPAQVCKDWEAAALSVSDVTRVAVVRTGIVLGNTGGALSVMEKAFRMALGGKIGKGDQVMSWIHIRDLVNIYRAILENENYAGIINAVSPHPVTNEHFTKTFAKVLNQPAVFTIPKFALKLAYGEAAETMATGQTVLPEKLQKEGFQFQYPTVEKALLNLFRFVV